MKVGIETNFVPAYGGKMTRRLNLAAANECRCEAAEWR